MSVDSVKEHLPTIPWEIKIIEEIALKLNLSKRDVIRGLIYFNKPAFEEMQKKTDN